MTVRQRILVLLPFIAILFTSGCVVAAAAVAGVAYVEGVATKTYSHPIEKCRPAVMETFEKLGLKVDTQEGDNLKYKFSGKTGQKGSVEVVLAAKNENTTDISIRFGVFGDKTKSSRFHEELSKILD